MPIDYKEYHPKWKLISRLIRIKRAHNKCEWCGIRNHAIIKRNVDGTFRSPSRWEWDMIYSRINNSHSSMTESLTVGGFGQVGN